jgi:ABC-2 type transport system ATP-binding protein
MTPLVHDGPAIRVKDLSRRFGDFTAVDGVDLEVGHGELFSLLGPNGAGKTTIIKMLCGLLRPSDGTATVMGHDIADDPIAVKQVIAVSPQETAIAEHMNARENLDLMARLHGIGKDEARLRAANLLQMLGLSDRAGERVKRYSGGMKRRLSIAMALVSDPQVLFLDEPTLGLDPQSRRVIWQYVEAWKGEKTILLTTHYLEEADALADRIAIIDEGGIIALGSAEQLKASISDGDVTLVEAEGLTADAADALKQLYPDVRVVADGVEIRALQVNLYDIQDVLRPRGIVVQSAKKKTVSLDDVFVHYTGKELRE